jgi:hypothetical protein
MTRPSADYTSRAQKSQQKMPFETVLETRAITLLGGFVVFTELTNKLLGGRGCGSLKL